MRTCQHEDSWNQADYISDSRVEFVIVGVSRLLGCCSCFVRRRHNSMPTEGDIRLQDANQGLPITNQLRQPRVPD